MNNNVSTELYSGKSVEKFDIAFTQSAEANDKLAERYLAEYEQTGDSALYSLHQKATTAAKYQRKALALSDDSKRAMLKNFNIGKCASACSDSYSLAKLASMADVLNAGVWSAHSDDQLANFLAKACDEQRDTTLDLAAVYRMFDSKRQREMCAGLCERLGMLTRSKTGRAFTHFEIHEAKVWQSLAAALEA